MEGAVGYEETTGAGRRGRGRRHRWMRASGGVWHTSSLGGEGLTQAISSWLAMPAALELGGAGKPLSVGGRGAGGRPCPRRARTL